MNLDRLLSLDVNYQVFELMKNIFIVIMFVCICYDELTVIYFENSTPNKMTHYWILSLNVDYWTFELVNTCFLSF